MVAMMSSGWWTAVSTSMGSAAAKHRENLDLAQIRVDLPVFVHGEAGGQGLQRLLPQLGGQIVVLVDQGVRQPGDGRVHPQLLQHLQQRVLIVLQGLDDNGNQ